jgi:hypothetical protein
MKVTLDLSALVAGGQLTQAEAERLKSLSATQTGSMGANVLLAFGAVAVALGAAALVPTAQTAIVIGALFVAAGLGMRLAGMQRWSIFAQIVMVIGALGVVAGIWILSNGDWQISLAMAIGLGVVAAAARSGLLAALAVLMLAVALGSSTAYLHASYFLGIDRPALTILVLSGLTLVLYVGSLRLPADFERLAIIAARSAILMINLAFLVGSLFGDEWLRLPGLLFSVVWAVLLIGAIVWGVAVNRSWLVNAAAVFGAIHFYTQWFETLGPTQLSVLGGGLLLIVFGLILARFNSWLSARRGAGPVSSTAGVP